MSCTSKILTLTRCRCAVPFTKSRAPRLSSLHTSRNSSKQNQDDITLKELYDKFKDPNTHYHIPDGTSGPAHEDDHSTSRSLPSVSSTLTSTSTSNNTRAKSKTESKSDRPWLESERGVEQRALEYFREEGYDIRGVLQWPVAWGDCDMFHHVNNVKITGWFESARIRYAESWAPSLPDGMVMNMLLGKGTGFIVKDLSVKYKAPVTYPDTMMISSKVHTLLPDRASFKLQHLAWSMKDQQVKAICDSTIVMYDFHKLKKGVMVPELQKVLEDAIASYKQ